MTPPMFEVARRLLLEHYHRQPSEGHLLRGADCVRWGACAGIVRDMDALLIRFPRRTGQWK